MKNIIFLLEFIGQFFAMGIGIKKEFVETAFVFRIQSFFQELMRKDIKMFDFIIEDEEVHYKIKIFRFFQNSKRMNENKISWRIYVAYLRPRFFYKKDNLYKKSRYKI